MSKSYDNSILSGLMFRTPYSYNWHPDSYKPRYPNDLDNKLGNLTLPQMNEIRKQYKEDKPAFYSFLTGYIEQQEVVFSINELVQHHHILDVRKEIIYETLNIYKHGAKITY